VRDALSQSLKDGSRPLERGRVAADEEGERAFDRALLAAGDRCSRRKTPRSESFAAIARAASAAIVEQSITIAPLERLSAAPAFAEEDRFDLRGSGRHVTRTSDSLPTSEKRSKAFASGSSDARARAFDAVRVAIARGKPAFARLRAIGAPIVPRPMNPGAKRHRWRSVTT
jgi:hypothetical protein